MTTISWDVLRLDPEKETGRITEWIRGALRTFKRRGLVVGLSGGVDSSVVAALAARAVGAGHVLGVLMPEGESDPQSLELGREVAQRLGVSAIVEDITPMLRAEGGYERRDDAIRRVVPEYGPGATCKLVTADAIHTDSYPVPKLVVKLPNESPRPVRLNADVASAIIAATNFKQRTRIMIEYYHADRLRYAVAGTANRLEHAQGFFVKNGDGAADLKPIAHLYKTQVYQLAEYLDVPQSIRSRTPTSDTYPLDQSQEEFYFMLPLNELDLCLYGLTHSVPAGEVATLLHRAPPDIERVYRYLTWQRRSTRYVHAEPLTLEDVL